jgi:gamma-glutamyltranspeptidase/glutathione hydrolase
MSQPATIPSMFRITLAALTAVAATAQPLGRDYGRSMVISRQGIAATSQVLASAAAAQILAKGGSAVDAAIAANAVLAVTEPMMDGIGGDLFAIYWDANSGKLTALNSSGPAARALTPAFLASHGIHDKMPVHGIHTVTVPGAVRGWAAMHSRYGKLPWRDLFTAAIAYARDGYPVPEVLAVIWSLDSSIKVLESNPETTRVFLPGGKPPKTGEIVRNPELAHTLEIIAAQGPDAFYRGEIASSLLATSRKLGGTLTAEDLAAFEPEWVEPVSSTYRGWRVYEMPPNDQGMAALEMLNIMETFEPSPEGPLSAQEMHKRIEAMKLAYADLARYNADPRFAHVPVAGLLAKPYAAERAALINPDQANCDVRNGIPVRGDTTYLAVVDRDGNIASWIQSISGTFGSGVTVEGRGILLQNRGALFSLDPKSPNILAGGKRPFHTIIPAFMEKGDIHIGFGIMGGPNQPLAHAQFVSNIVDYGMNIQSALEEPRFTKPAAHGCDVTIESRVPETTLQKLSERGHQIQIARPYTSQMGRGNAVLHDSAARVNYAASDPRADGAAVPELPAN